jgi:hypothetical protein
MYQWLTALMNWSKRMPSYGRLFPVSPRIHAAADAEKLHW